MPNYQTFNTRNENENKNKIPKIIHSSEKVVIYDAYPFIISKFPEKYRFKVEHSRFDNFHLNGLYHGRSTFNLKVPKFWSNQGLAGTWFITRKNAFSESKHSTRKFFLL